MAGFSERAVALAGLGGAKWAFYFRAKARLAAGEDIINLTIGQPEVAPPPDLGQALQRSLAEGRIGYSNGAGDLTLRQILADRYTRRTGRVVSLEEVLIVSGTQNALYLSLQTLAGPGDEVIVTDPLYATYEGVVRASGATPIFVPLRADLNFHLQATDVAAKISPRTKALLLNSPHNPTGAVLSDAEIALLGALACKHDFWIISDEVYEELVFDTTVVSPHVELRAGCRPLSGAQGPDERYCNLSGLRCGAFASAFDRPELAERTVALSSLSKSHAAAGYRAGWLVGPHAVIEAALPLTETEIFGTPPFIQDATATILAQGPSKIAAVMRANYARRAADVYAALDGQGGITVTRPEAGMFVLLDARARGASSIAFATHLLDQAGVATMPGSSFGAGLEGFVRVSLTVEDQVLTQALTRIRSSL